MSGSKLNSGGGLLAGFIPVISTLDATKLEGRIFYCADGTLQFSDGTDWIQVPNPPVSRPSALTPTTIYQQSILRLTSFLSNPTYNLTQTGVVFEISLNADMSSPLKTQIYTNDTARNAYSIQPGEVAIAANQTFYWRGKYLATGNQESLFSKPQQQLFPQVIITPTPLVANNAVTATLKVSAYVSPFSLTYLRTEWEVYTNSTATGTPALGVSSTSANLDVTAYPVLTSGGSYYWRARHVDVAGNTSDWTTAQGFTKPTLDFVYTINTALSTGTTTNISVTAAGGGKTFTIDWGDLATTTSSTGGTFSHTYASGGVYTVSISGKAYAIGFNAYATRTNLTAVTSFGSGLGLGAMDYAFAGCTNLVAVPSYFPATVNRMRSGFDSCTKLNDPSIGSWDVSNLAYMDALFNNCISFNQPLPSWTFQAMAAGDPSIQFNSMFNGCAAFNQSLDSWNVAGVKNFYQMFKGCTSFNKPLNSWNMSSATKLDEMFSGCIAFNQDLYSWDTSNVLTTPSMFNNCTSFNGRIGTWNLSKATSLASMFSGCTALNQNLNSWAPSAAISFESMFGGCTAFNGEIGNWNVSLGSNFRSMFYGCTSFNKPLMGWSVANAIDIGYMFYGCTAFNGDLSSWRPGKATNFSAMFAYCYAYNQSMSNWNVGATSLATATIDFSQMFQSCSSLNQSFTTWDMSKASSLSRMFIDCVAFNGDVTTWRPGKCTTFQDMFNRARVFNQNVSNWNVGANIATTDTISLSFMFNEANAFNQSLATWNISKMTTASNLFTGCPVMSSANYSATLIGWAAQTVKPNVVMNSSSSSSPGYLASATAARATLTGSPNNWTITDGGLRTS